MRNHETGLDYANTDPSLHYNGVTRRTHGPTWHSVWIYLLKIGDEDAAQLVKDQNTNLTLECEYGDHDLCHYPPCECVCHRTIVLKSEGAPLKSCREMQSEQEESEANAA